MLKHTWIIKTIYQAAFFLFSLLLFACAEQVDSTPTKTLSGSVGDGPIINANVALTDRDNMLIANTVSDSTANYSVYVPSGNLYPLLLTATGGTDVVTNSAPDFTLISTAIDASVATININPFSTLVVKVAQMQPGDLTGVNLSNARNAVTQQLNFGLDTNLVPDPILTPVTANNAATIIKASEALAETIRRTQNLLMSAGVDVSIDAVLSSVAADLTDGVLDGRGRGADAQIAAFMNIVSGQVLVETLTNRLVVGGSEVTNRLDAAIAMSVPDATMSTADVNITAAVLTQTQKALAGAHRFLPSSELYAIASLLAGLSGNLLAADIDSILPTDVSTVFDAVNVALTTATTDQFEKINSSVRAGNLVLEPITTTNPDPVPVPEPVPNPTPIPTPVPTPAGDSAPVTTFTYSVSDAIFDNPERGFHGVSHVDSTRNFSDHNAAGQTLTFGHIKLDNFRDRALSATMLNNIRSGFNAIRDAGLKAVIRVSYNSSSGAPDAPKSWILEHIRQLSPIFHEHEDVIFLVESGFIGAWGEWHSSTNGLNNPTDQLDILQALLDAIPKSRMTTLRYPRHKLEMYPPLDATTGFDQGYAARVGHHNDCFLRNEHDGATYFGNDFSSYGGYKDYIGREAIYTPVGGETCGMDTTYSRQDEALVELERMHWTFINEEFYAPMISYWKTTATYDSMRRKLGYRFNLTQADIPAQILPGGNFEFRVEIKNQGWANLYNPRPLFIALDGGTKGRYNVKLDAIDPRKWIPGQTTVVAAQLELPADIPVGDYTLALWLPDAFSNLRARPEYSIRLANVNVWDAVNGYNILGSVRVDPTAQGSSNNSAVNFRVVTMR